MAAQALGNLVESESLRHQVNRSLLRDLGRDVGRQHAVAGIGNQEVDSALILVGHSRRHGNGVFVLFGIERTSVRFQTSGMCLIGSHAIEVQEVVHVTRVQTFVLAREQNRDSHHQLHDLFIDLGRRSFLVVLEVGHRNRLLGSLNDAFEGLQGIQGIFDLGARVSNADSNSDHELVLIEEFLDQGSSQNTTSTARSRTDHDVSVARAMLLKHFLGTLHDQCGVLLTLFTGTIDFREKVNLFHRHVGFQVRPRGIEVNRFDLGHAGFDVTAVVLEIGTNVDARTSACEQLDIAALGSVLVFGGIVAHSACFPLSSG